MPYKNIVADKICKRRKNRMHFFSSLHCSYLEQQPKLEVVEKMVSISAVSAFDAVGSVIFIAAWVEEKYR